MSSCMRNPCMVRIVTMLLLTVSDIDVALSVVFILNLWNKFSVFRQSGEGLLEGVGIIYPIALCLLIMGFTVYGLGICFFGPRQRRKVMKLVIDQMEKSGSEFTSPMYRRLNGTLISESENGFYADGSQAIKVTMNSSVYPEHKSQANNSGHPITKFIDLCCDDKDDRSTCQEGLFRWGLGTIWQAVQVNNEKNCVDLVHGLPLVRTARFGFMPQPSPKELGGIFNANALYSFAVGTFELGFGGMMLWLDGVTLMTVLPFGVSVVSFVLSLANVIFDFSAILLQIEMEERMGETIKSRIEASQTTMKARIVEKKDRDEAAIRNRLKGTDSATLLRKQRELEQLNSAYANEIQSLDNGMLREMESEITAWQRKLQKERDLLRGKRAKVHDQQPRAGSFVIAEAAEQAAEQFAATINAKIKEVEDDARNQINALDVKDANFDSEVSKITDIQKKNVKMLRKHLNTDEAPKGGNSPNSGNSPKGGNSPNSTNPAGQGLLG